MLYNIVNLEQRAGDFTTVTNPRTNEPFLEVTVASKADLNDAVQAARVAFDSWKLLSVQKRQGYLLKLADELEQRRHEIHGPLAGETGKSVRNLFDMRRMECPFAKLLHRTSSPTLRSMIHWNSLGSMVLVSMF